MARIIYEAKKAPPRRPMVSSLRLQQPSLRELPLFPNEVFRLLDLPPELVTNVLDKAAKEDAAWVIPRGSGKLVSAHGLSRVNKQIHVWYIDRLYISAATFNFAITNFNFGEVLTFLNNLSDNHLNSLKKNSRPTPKVHIRLQIPDPSASTTSNLKRWLNRFDDEAKKGVSDGFEYVFSRTISRSNLRRLDYWVDLMEADSQSDGESGRRGEKWWQRDLMMSAAVEAYQDLAQFC